MVTATVRSEVDTKLNAEHGRIFDVRRAMVVARMVIAATLTMILVMMFRIPGGFEGALYAFLVARDDLRSTLRSGVAVAVSYTIGVRFVLMCAALFASYPDARFLWFALSMFVVFFALSTFENFAIAIGFAIILVLALPIWQTPTPAEHRVELTLWQAFACCLGTLVTIGVEAVFHSLFPKNRLLQGLDDRLSAVQGLTDAFGANAPVSDDVANRLAKYTIVGVSGLRRILARSRHESLDRDRLASVIALTGRLVDLGASSAKSPITAPECNRERLKRFVAQIAALRRSLAESTPPEIQTGLPGGPSAIPLLPEMERTASLIPQVFAGSESVAVYFPSMLDEPEPVDRFFKKDAFQNPAHIHFALRGCLAATLCYFTYEILNWRGIATSVTTCVLTALSNLGTSRQKQFLRISGAVAGGLILGIGSQVFILPYLDGITGFSLLFAAVTAVAAWFATSSQRLAYFGLQIANAFYLITVQEFTIQTSLATARDRVVGVMLGLFMMWLAYHSFSKDSAAEHMVPSFAANLRAIAELALQPGSEPTKPHSASPPVQSKAAFRRYRGRCHLDRIARCREVLRGVESLDHVCVTRGGRHLPVGTGQGSPSDRRNGGPVAEDLVSVHPHIVGGSSPREIHAVAFHGRSEQSGRGGSLGIGSWCDGHSHLGRRAAASVGGGQGVGGGRGGYDRFGRQPAHRAHTVVD